MEHLFVSVVGLWVLTDVMGLIVLRMLTMYPFFDGPRWDRPLRAAHQSINTAAVVVIFGMLLGVDATRYVVLVAGVVYGSEMITDLIARFWEPGFRWRNWIGYLRAPTSEQSTLTSEVQ